MTSFSFQDIIFIYVSTTLLASIEMAPKQWFISRLVVKWFTWLAGDRELLGLILTTSDLFLKRTWELAFKKSMEEKGTLAMLL